MRFVNPTVGGLTWRGRELRQSDGSFELPDEAVAEGVPESFGLVREDVPARTVTGQRVVDIRQKARG